MVWLDWIVVLSPLIFGLSIAIHEKSDASVLVNGKLRGSPLQIAAFATLVITGEGSTVIVMVLGIPGHEPDTEVGTTE